MRSNRRSVPRFRPEPALKSAAGDPIQGCQPAGGGRRYEHDTDSLGTVQGTGRFHSHATTRSSAGWRLRAGAPRKRADAPAWSPVANISETETEYLIKAELPEVEQGRRQGHRGRGRDHDQRRTPQGSSSSKDEKVHRVESFYGNFSRSFRLPEDADVAAHPGREPERRAEGPGAQDARAEAQDGRSTGKLTGPGAAAECRRPGQPRVPWRPSSTQSGRKLQQQKQELLARAAKVRADITRSSGPLDKDFAEQVVQMENDAVLAGIGEATGSRARADQPRARPARRGHLRHLQPCGQPIGERRLQALPYSDRCISCAEAAG